MQGNDQTQRKILLIFGFVLFLVTLLSGLNPFDRVTWLMEVFPIFVALPVLFASYRFFRPC